MDKSEIRETVTALLSLSGIKRPPIDPLLLADQLGIKVFFENFKGSLEGVLLRNDQDTIILVGANGQYPGRERFTVAHELGHFLLPEHEERAYYCSVEDIWSYRKDKRIEDEANAFAAELLMPTKWIVPYLRKSPFSIDLVKKVAGEFNVSLTSAAIRLVNLSPDPAVLIMTREKRIIWSRRSSNFKGIIESDVIDESTFTARCYEKGLRNEMNGAVPAYYWLDNCPYRTVIESCIPMPFLGQVLTVLTLPFDEYTDELEEEQLYFDERFLF